MRKNIISILFLLLFIVQTSCSNQKVIVNGLEERDANEIVVLLASRGIHAQKVQSSQGGGAGQVKVVLWDIAVPKDQALEAMDILNAAGLPRRPAESLLNIFGNTGLVPSETSEKVRYEAGLAQQIASTIRKIDGVIDASVIISFPTENPLTGKTTQPITASVYVKHNGVLDDPNLHLVEKIKRLVSSSVAGLSLDNVTVVGDKAQMQAGPIDILQTVHQGQKLTDVWSIVLAENSVFRFQAIFLTLILLNLLFILCIIWILWKILPLLKKIGYSRLFKIRTITPKDFETAKEEKPLEPGKEAEKPEQKRPVENVEDISSKRDAP